MKKLLTSILLTLAVATCFSQTDSTASYWKNKAIPAFSLLKADSTLFGNEALSAGKSTIFMLFNPECEHCQEQFKLLVDIPGISKTTQVILSTTETLEKLNIFIEKFEVNNYPFVFIGKDYKYELGRVFQPKTIPVLVFYNKAAKFKAINQGQVSKKQLLKWLKEQNNN